MAVHRLLIASVLISVLLFQLAEADQMTQELQMQETTQTFQKWTVAERVLPGVSSRRGLAFARGLAGHVAPAAIVSLRAPLATLMSVHATPT
ncbi:uncharacterized protein LOC104448132 [Eucalyptus grandis]|uniref:uncharacterized protein LOC104448132 n=1 Tax=Eucalyptus grandis TaxID=71139 RepID=UPI00192EAE61|nr:uncharacterized protein LOC104448132 [Eucalyptus grandis]